MAKRVKKTIITGITAWEAEEAFASYAKADAQQAKITAEIELACAKIREKHQDQLAALQQTKDEAFERLQTYAVENQSELFAKRKSLEMTHGVIGFRTGQPKCKTARGTTWADALELVKDRLPNYIRTKEEVDKDRLLADRNLPCRRDDEPEEAARPLLHEMALCGILVVQEESFFVEPKREEAAS